MDRLKCIRTFVQVARSHGLSTAARELGISKSLASHHLQQLETHLGVRLVNRTTRRVVLTQIGEEYLHLCLKALDGLDAADARISDMQTQVCGEIKVMATMGFATIELAPVMVDFNRLYPDVTASLILFDRPFFADEFIEGAYDVGISMHAMKDTALISTKVGDVTWIPCASAGYLAEHGPVATPQDLERRACIVHKSHAPDRVWQLVGAKSRCDVAVTGPLFTNSLLVLRYAVEQDLGVGMFPAYAVERELASGALVRILPEWRSITRPVFLVYPQASHLPRRTRVFIDYLRKELRARSIARQSLLERAGEAYSEPGIIAETPPSTNSSAPSMKSESSETRNSTARARSIG